MFVFGFSMNKLYKHFHPAVECLGPLSIKTQGRAGERERENYIIYMYSYVWIKYIKLRIRLYNIYRINEINEILYYENNGDNIKTRLCGNSIAFTARNFERPVYRIVYICGHNSTMGLNFYWRMLLDWGEISFKGSVFGWFGES